MLMFIQGLAPPLILCYNNLSPRAAELLQFIKPTLRLFDKLRGGVPKWLLRETQINGWKPSPRFANIQELREYVISRKYGGVPKWLKGMVC